MDKTKLLAEKQEELQQKLLGELTVWADVNLDLGDRLEVQVTVELSIRHAEPVTVSIELGNLYSLSMTPRDFFRNDQRFKAILGNDNSGGYYNRITGSLNEREGFPKTLQEFIQKGPKWIITDVKRISYDSVRLIAMIFLDAGIDLSEYPEWQEWIEDDSSNRISASLGKGHWCEYRELVKSRSENGCVSYVSV